MTKKRDLFNELVEGSDALAEQRVGKRLCVRRVLEADVADRSSLRRSSNRITAWKRPVPATRARSNCRTGSSSTRRGVTGLLDS